LRWQRAQQEYESSLTSGLSAQAIDDLRRWEDRFRIAFEDSFHTVAGRWPRPEEFAEGELRFSGVAGEAL
jgi:hypothetical protein